MAWSTTLLVMPFVVAFLPQTQTTVLHQRIEDGKDSVLGNYSSAAISIDGRPCAKIGMDVIRTGGNVVDAAVAALMCDGLYNPHSLGIGGGFLMTLYLRDTETVTTLNARETAPAYSYPDMFDGDEEAPRTGPLAIAIPGQVRGLYEAKQRYGNPDVSWASLIQPSIDMCLDGIEVGFSLAKEMVEAEEAIRNDPGLSEVFINPATGQLYNEGDRIQWPTMAETLTRIADNGADEFYSGITAINAINDLQQKGGNITLEDWSSYEVVWSDPVTADLGDGRQLHSVPPPGSGAVVTYILNILKNYNYNYEIDEADVETPLLYHRIAEAFKWAYALRTKLGDPFDDEYREYILEAVANLTSDAHAFSSFSMINDSFTVNNASYYGADFDFKEDHGTAHVSILGPNGDAVSITSTINIEFGAKILSPSTGIIFNDEMDDFSFPNVTNYFGVPPSPMNYAKPGKRPLSSMSPVIVVDEVTKEPVLVLGAAGGTRISTSTALVTLKNVWLKQNIKEAIDGYRLHHQLIPMAARCEGGISQDILDFLVSRGHELDERTNTFSVVLGVSKENGRVLANADFRKDGAVDGF